MDKASDEWKYCRTKRLNGVQLCWMTCFLSDLRYETSPWPSVCHRGRIWELKGDELINGINHMSATKQRELRGCLVGKFMSLLETSTEKLSVIQSL